MTVEERFKEYDVALEALFKKAREEGHTIPCKRGCDACCYEAVVALSIELGPMVKELRSMSKETLNEIRERIEAWAVGMRKAGLDPKDSEPDVHAYYRAHLPCPLLDEKTHECRVYRTRPGACRGHHIVDASPEVCANRGIEKGVPWLEIRESHVFPFLAGLAEEAAKGLPEGEDVMLAVGLLPGVLAVLWRQIDRSMSHAEHREMLARMKGKEKP